VHEYGSWISVSILLYDMSYTCIIGYNDFNIIFSVKLYNQHTKGSCGPVDVNIRLKKKIPNLLMN